MKEAKKNTYTQLPEPKNKRFRSLKSLLNYCGSSQINFETIFLNHTVTIKFENHKIIISEVLKETLLNAFIERYFEKGRYISEQEQNTLKRKVKGLKKSFWWTSRIIVSERGLDYCAGQDHRAEMKEIKKDLIKL